MKVLRIAGIPAVLVLCVGMAFGQDASHSVDKATVKTGHVVKHAGHKIGHATKTGVKDAGHGTKVLGKDSAKGVKKTGKGIKDAARE